jgi:2-methylcitrate dehydratase PrpD
VARGRRKPSSPTQFGNAGNDRTEITGRADHVEITSALAEFAASSDQGSVPASVAKAVGLQILDLTGCIVAARKHPLLRAFCRALSYWGGSCDHGAVSLALGERLPPLQAVAVDAFAGRLCDSDPIHDATGDHPAVSAGCAALVTAQMMRSTGADVAAAVAVGEEVQLRIRLGSKQRVGVAPGTHPWTTGTYAPFGAAVAAARLHRSNAQMLRDAIGMAFTECSNTMQSHREGAASHYVHQGTATAAGMLCALIASEGIPAIQHPLEGSFGLYRAFHHQANAGDDVLDGLGTEWHSEDIAIKTVPACRFADPVVNAVQLASSSPDFRWEDLTAVRIGVNRQAYETAVPDEPFPRTTAAAQFDLRYIAALAICGFPLSLDVLQTLPGRYDFGFMRLLRSIEVEVDPDLNGGDQITAASIEFHSSDGSTHRVEARPSAPDEEAVIEKFRAGCSFGGIGRERTESLVDALSNLAELQNLDDVWAALQTNSASSRG